MTVRETVRTYFIALVLIWYFRFMDFDLKRCCWRKCNIYHIQLELNWICKALHSDCNILMSDLNSIVVCVDKKKWYINETMRRSSSAKMDRRISSSNGLAVVHVSHTIYLFYLNVEIISSICVRCANSVNYAMIAALASHRRNDLFLTFGWKTYKNGKVYSAHKVPYMCYTIYNCTSSNTQCNVWICGVWCINRKISHPQQNSEAQGK